MPVNGTFHHHSGSILSPPRKLNENQNLNHYHSGSTPLLRLKENQDSNHSFPHPFLVRSNSADNLLVPRDRECQRRCSWKRNLSVGPTRRNSNSICPLQK